LPPRSKSGDRTLDEPASSNRARDGSFQDISADLPELARTQLVVVCSGPKSLVNVMATREWLETHGITIAGYQCDEMPAFYSRQSGVRVDVRCDSADEVVQLLKAQRALEIEAALLVAVPVPAEAEVASETLEAALDKASSEAERSRITGGDLTPFLLSRMTMHSQGATLRANIALLENNARVAAEIATSLTRQT
jgi:pseudouridine-5'-phosphate glycosidase